MVSKKISHCPYCGASIKSEYSSYCDECGEYLSFNGKQRQSQINNDIEDNRIPLSKIFIIIGMLCVIIFLTGFILVNTGVIGEHYDIIIDHTWVQDFGDSRVYTVNGRIVNSPDTSENDYIIQVEFYDANNNLLSNPTQSLRDANSWNVSGRIGLGIYSTHDNPVVDHVIVKLLNHDGRVVGEVSNTFNMNDVVTYA